MTTAAETIGRGGRVPIGKRVAALVLVGVILTALGACASPRDEGGPDPGLRGQWQLQSATDRFGAVPLANQLITLTIRGDNSTTGRSTCGGYTAHVFGDRSQLWIVARAPVAQACQSDVQQAIAFRYLDALNNVRTSTVSGGVMHLLASGIDLQYHRALAVPLGLVVGHTWKLSTVLPDNYYPPAVVPVPTPAKGASIRFAADGRLSGQTECNTFSGDYVQDAGELVVSNLRKTVRYLTSARLPCGGDAHTTDVELLTVLTSGFTFLSEAGALKLSSPRAELTMWFEE